MIPALSVMGRLSRWCSSVHVDAVPRVKAIIVPVVGGWINAIVGGMTWLRSIGASLVIIFLPASAWRGREVIVLGPCRRRDNRGE